MKKYTILIFVIAITLSLTSISSFSDSINNVPTNSKPIVVVIDGEEVIINAISENGQLYLAIDELAPVIGLEVNTANENKPIITSTKADNLNITKATLSFSTNLISNNSVGNEWNYYIKVNNNTYNSNQQDTTIELNGDNIPIELVVYEYDESKSDFGSSSVVVPYSELIKGQTLTYRKVITVTENGGKYSGNTATIQFNLTVTPK